MTLHELQESVLDLVGPANWRDLGITQATLQLQARQLPRLTLECEVLPLDRAHDVQRVTRCYELREISEHPPSAPLDLDAITERIRVRERGRIEAAARVVLRTFDVRARALCAQVDQQLASHQDTVAAVTHRLTAPRSQRLQRISVPVTRSGVPHRELAIFAAWPIGTALLIAFVLGWFGPALDAQPDRRHEVSQADKQLRAELMAERWEVDARRRCAEQGGDNTGWIATANGSIVCTDKRGRRQVARKEAGNVPR